MRPLRLTATLAIVWMAAAAVIALPLTVNRAFAATGHRLPKPIECRAASGGASSVVVVGRCDRDGITGRSGSLANCPAGQCISWATGKSLDVSSSVTVPSESRCSSGLVEVDTVGKVVSGSGASTGPFIGATVAYDACLTQQINVVMVGLVAGTVFTIG